MKDNEKETLTMNFHISVFYITSFLSYVNILSVEKNKNETVFMFKTFWAKYCFIHHDILKCIFR